MNRSIRRLGTGVLVLFVLLTVTLGALQVVRADEYRNDPRNLRSLLGPNEHRGDILSADGVILAESVKRADASRIRRYPHGARHAHTVGYVTRIFGSRGIEATRANDLVVTTRGVPSDLVARFVGLNRAHDVRLTIDDRLQRTLESAFGDQRGAAVFLDPETGAVMASISRPSFDPNRLIGFDATAVGEALAADPQQPQLDRTRGITYPPGSAFKIVVAAAAIESGLADPGTEFADPRELELPGTTATISNFDGQVCDDGTTATLRVAFVKSCNTVFAALGVELGPETMAAAASRFGFGAEVPYEFSVVSSVFPLSADIPALAQNSLGERDVRTTVLHMALIGAATVNDGVMPVPRLVAAVIDPDRVERTVDPELWRQAMTATTARTLRDLMIETVLSGTGRQAAVEGLVVGGKTGTPEVPDSPPHTWFVGFAESPDGGSIAFAVLVESGGDLGPRGTGGSVAAPIAARVLETWRDLDR